MPIGGLLLLTTVVLLVLNLSGIIAISYWLVFLPLLISVVLVLVLTMFAVGILGIVHWVSGR